MTQKIPTIPDDQKTPIVTKLLEIINIQKEQIQALKDEIAILKGEKQRPKIKPSKLENDSPTDDTDTDSDDTNSDDKGKRPGSKKKSKKNKIKIHKTKVVKAKDIPDGSKFKGYEDFVVQGLVIKSRNICYRRERWLTPDGKTIIAPLPNKVKGHFNTKLTSYVLYLYNQGHMTQPLILEHLLGIGIDISVGQINNILNEDKEDFHAEKDEILQAGLEVSSYVNVDDTGARHKGRNGYCTHIGNELFAWFKSTESKSRINFLKLLRAEHDDYLLSAEAFDYMVENKLPKAQLESLKQQEQTCFENEKQWNKVLEDLGFTNKRHIRIATEGALLGSILEHGLNPKIIILSDDAGQFDVFLHALCWIHAERAINKLIGFDDEQRTALDEIRSKIWEFYRKLKAYKKEPSTEEKSKLELNFDEIFTSKTCFETLNQALKRIYSNKSELLLVLEYPFLPLHNNLSENDIREYVKKRKISGSTRSDAGRRSRDTFTSLKKTCRKLGISFWHYINDRISGSGKIPRLADLIRQRACQTEPP